MKKQIVVITVIGQQAAAKRLADHIAETVLPNFLEAANTMTEGDVHRMEVTGPTVEVAYELTDNGEEWSQE